MNELLFAINGLIMLAAPLIVGTYLARRYGADWGLFGAGAITFVAAQLLHIPFNALIERTFLVNLQPELFGHLLLLGAFYGLSAGLFEEVGRYLTFRFWRKDAHEWRHGMMVGAGHGGIESLILGLLFVVNIIVILGVDRGYFAAMFPAEMVADVQAQAQALTALPWYEKVLGGVERIFAIILHLCLSLMVMRSVRRRALLWLFAAIGLHALFNAVAVVLSQYTSALMVEAVLGLFALLFLALIVRWREEPRVEDEIEAPPAPEVVLGPRDLSPKDEDLDASRYS